MKRITLVICTLISTFSYAQSFNEDKTAFVNFIKPMPTSAPFDGVKIVEHYSHHYLISVVSLEKAK